jgi:hypothetical protein
MRLHAEIMNIRCTPNEADANCAQAYRAGHMAARDAAAELAKEADALIHEMREALEWMVETFGDRNRLPKVLEAAAAIHKAGAAIASATGEHKEGQ